MTRNPALYLALLTMTLGWLAGCQSPHQDPRLAHLTIPADFAVELFVQPADDHEQSPARRYVIEPDRRLRGWEGPRVTADRLPPPLRTLNAREVEQVVTLINQHELMAEPVSPLAQTYLDTQQASEPMYHVTITARGRTTRFVTTANESPPTARLVDLLQRFAGQTASGLPALLHANQPDRQEALP